MDNYNKSTDEVKQPDFHVIFTELRIEVARAAEITRTVSTFGNMLKPNLHNKQMKESIPEVKSEGVISMLLVEISKLKEANEEGENNIRHLREIIGS
jgi:hypothetical protein